MQKVLPGQDVLSLYTVFNRAKEGLFIRHRLMLALISAFFVVLIAAATVNVMKGIWANAAVTNYEEKVAFIPGQYIGQDISRGYLGR